MSDDPHDDRETPQPADAIDTRLAHLGRDPARQYGFVNPPVARGSTVIFPTWESFVASGRTPYETFGYGRVHNPTADAFERALCALEGGHRTLTTPSGLSACTLPLQALLSAGDHVLLTDCVYGPVRRFADRHLRRWGVTIQYYRPGIGAGIADLLRPETRLIYLEAPGSLTFEMEDVAAIAALARARRIATCIDATWASPLFFQPLALGVDVSIQAATKYLVGHADAMLGAVTSTERFWDRLKGTAVALGLAAGVEDLWLGLRGLRTLAVRLRRHQAGALAVAAWLRGRPEVAEVLHPGLPGAPGHELWRAQMTGASGLFAAVLHKVPRAALESFLDGLRLFGMGSSWGGYESLAILADLAHRRDRADDRPVLRFHVGLEDPCDLIADLTEGFGRLRAAA